MVFTFIIITLFVAFGKRKTKKRYLHITSHVPSRGIPNAVFDHLINYIAYPSKILVYILV